METPQAISSRVPPRSFHSGRFLCLASASQTAASRAPFGHIVPANGFEHRGYVSGSGELFPFHERPKMIAQYVPGGLDGFRAIVRSFAGHAFGPAGDAIDISFHQQDAAIVTHAIADLEWRDQPHPYFPQRDLANAHASLSPRVQASLLRFSLGLNVGLSIVPRNQEICSASGRFAQAHSGIASREALGEFRAETVLHAASRDLHRPVSIAPGRLAFRFPQTRPPSGFESPLMAAITRENPDAIPPRDDPLRDPGAADWW